MNQTFKFYSISCSISPQKDANDIFVEADDSVFNLSSTVVLW
uniref:Uncharacterized protein n=1 Tax=Brugia malayi TaxID=6279 RepID=A8QEN1_BRUMA